MNDSKELVILVDENDQAIGLMGKLGAHLEGMLHRAFSVIIFNANGDILLQQRAAHKYHSQKLWTNACCSHPRAHEEMESAVHRRLVEEMAFDCALQKISVLHYRTPPLDTGVVENEMLHLYAGKTEYAEFTPNPDEVMDWRWISPDDLDAEIAASPDSFSFWFQIYLQRFDMKSIFQSL